MGDSEETKVPVYLLHACFEECTCSGDECKAERLYENLKSCSDRQNIDWILASRIWNTNTGSSFLESACENIYWSYKVLVLWNRRAGEFVERSDDEIANREERDINLAKFANFYRNTSFVQVDKGSGNFLVHVKLEENAVPEYVDKWEDATTCTTDSVIKRIKERVLDFRDLSPCGRVGYGLASTFYLGYLNVHLPDYKSKFDEKNFPNPHEKLMIIIPKSGRCLKDIPGLTHVKNVCRKRDVAGILRPYSNTVYKIKDGTMVYHASVEYATPVRALLHMRNLRIAGLSTYWLREETDTIFNELTMFLENDDFANSVDLIQFDDIELDEKNESDQEYIKAAAEPLRKALLARIKQQ